jgi:phosphonate transport system substrate-binding protein
MVRKLVSFALCAALATTVACDKKTPEKKTDQTKESAKTAAQAADKEEKLELTMALAPAADAATVKPQAEKFASALADATGYGVEVTLPESYGETIQKMRKGEVQVAYFPAWAFLRAHLQADASLLVAEEVDGKTAFGAHWYVPSDSKLDDVKALEGKKVAFGSPESASGFLFPYASLIEAGVVTKGVELKDTFGDIALNNSDEEALKLLLEGKMDAAAASQTAFEALPEAEQKKLKSIADLGPVPTAVFAARADVRLDDQKKLAEALASLSEKEEYKKLFGENKKLVKRSHGDHVTALQAAQELAETEYPVTSDATGAKKAPPKKAAAKPKSE